MSAGSIEGLELDRTKAVREVHREYCYEQDDDHRYRRERNKRMTTCVQFRGREILDAYAHRAASSPWIDRFTLIERTLHYELTGAGLVARSTA
jgi:hypothetical protein